MLKCSYDVQGYFDTVVLQHFVASFNRLAVHFYVYISQAHRLPTVTAVCVPDHVEGKKLTQYAMERSVCSQPCLQRVGVHTCIDICTYV